MNKIVALFVSLFLSYPTYAAGPVIWGPGGAQNISSGPVYDNNVPYIKQPQTNYVANQSAGIDTTGWTSTGTFGIARVTSGLPRANTVGTGLSFTSGGVDEYAQYCFTLDDSDLNTKLSWSWSQAPSSYAAGDLVAQVYSFATANCGGAATQLYIDQVPSGQDYSIPNYTGPLDVTFDTSSNLYYGIRYTRKAGSSTLVVSNVIVGPGEIIAMPAVGPIPSYTPTIQGFGTPTITSMQLQRDGKFLRGLVRFSPSSTSSDEARFGLPSGLTVGYTNSPSALLVGRWYRNTSSATTVKAGTLHVLQGQTYIRFGFDDYTSSQSPTTSRNGDGVSSGTDSIFLDFEVPIAEWADTPSYVASAKQAVVNAKFTTATGTLAPNNSFVPVTFGTADANNTGGITRSGDEYTVEHSGFYEINANVTILNTNVAANYYSLQIYNSTTSASLAIGGYNMATASVNMSRSISSTIYLQAGHKFQIRLFANANHSVNTLSILTTAGYSWLTVNRVADEYGRPVVGFGYATSDSYGLVKLASGANAAEALVENLTVGSISTTFTSNGTGGGTSSAVTVQIKRSGNFVTLHIPSFVAAAGTGTPLLYASNTALPEWARPPSTTYSMAGLSQNNGTNSGEIARIEVASTGIISVRRNGAGNVAFQTGATGGLNTSVTITYYVP